MSALRRRGRTKNHHNGWWWSFSSLILRETPAGIGTKRIARRLPGF
jgi:hypothetical protein